MSFQYREIIAKSVIGRGRKFTKASHKTTPSHKPTNILGCWIINHQYQGKKKGNKIEIHGYYDINIWYSHHKNTKTEVATERITYTEEITLKYRSRDYLDDNELMITVIQQPNCVECKIADCLEKVIVVVEREFLSEVVGETKIVVATSEFADDDNSWEDSVDDDELADINPDIFQIEE